jgi:hypothetical protein
MRQSQSIPALLEDRLHYFAMRRRPDSMRW